MREFQPLDYDIYHVGVSGGKDSTATLLWVVKESGWPLDRVIVTFDETGNEDPLTYAYLDLLAEKVHPIVFIYPLWPYPYTDESEIIDFYDLARIKRRFPSRKARFCTQFLKVIPSREFVRLLMETDKNVLLINGVRKEEGHSSNHRGELEKFDFDEGWGCDIFRPLYDWSLADVWTIHKKYIQLKDVLALVRDDPNMDPEKKRKLIRKMRKHGVPRNPLYDMGASRVGCFPCINSNKREVRAMSEYRPARIEFLAEQEESVAPDRGISTFFARKTVPPHLRSKEIVTTKGETMRVATIHDVVTWSKTAWGGRKFVFLLETNDPQEALACDIGGMCE